MSRRATHARRADYPPVKTHKNQSFSSHKPSNGKKICFRNPRDAIYNFCYALKKLPDHFKEQSLLFDLFKTFDSNRVQSPNGIFFLPKRPIFLNACASGPQLPSNLSIMIPIQLQRKGTI